MRQILQSLKTGSIEVVNVPRPSKNANMIVVETTCSLVSTGTERMLIEFGSSSLVGKALQQPHRVKDIIDKCMTDGFVSTLEAVNSKLESPISLGYSNVGKVIEVGAEITDLKVGDRVVSNGPHAEIVCVPRNLCAKIPDSVSDEDAVFTVLASIALQGLRLAKPTLGESFVVIGLGLVGLLIVQLLKANGCSVIGIDLNLQRLKLARELGVDVLDGSDSEGLRKRALQLNGNKELDGALIATATNSSQPITDAVKICRESGRIILVGTAGLTFDRTDLYEKQLSFQVSRSYGLGRYDKFYEERANDYPIGHVRWTVRRNFEAVLTMMQEKKLELGFLISYKIPLQEAQTAYDLVVNNKDALGILFSYTSEGDNQKYSHSVEIASPCVKRVTSNGPLNIGFLGAGNYAISKLIPEFKGSNVRLINIAATRGSSCYSAAKKFGFRHCTTDPGDILDNDEIDAVVVATRHETHADFVIRALKRGKHVFVEKPLCTNEKELASIANALDVSESILAIGFNRRFSPHIKEAKVILDKVPASKVININVNAGTIPENHWTMDLQQGGGRLIGECCHFVDTLRFLIGYPIVNSQFQYTGNGSDRSFLINFKYADGSIGSINYLTNGPRSIPKERIEIYSCGRAIIIDNFRKLKVYGWPRSLVVPSLRQDKGQKACVASFLNSIRQPDVGPPIPYTEILETSDILFQIAAQLQNG